MNQVQDKVQYDKEMPDQVRHNSTGRFRMIIAFTDEEAAAKLYGWCILLCEAER